MINKPSSLFDEAYIQSISEDMDKTIREQFEMVGDMTPEEQEDFHTRMYLTQYFNFFKDVYGENPKYDYTREGNTINVAIYPYQPLDSIQIHARLKI